MNFEIFFMYFYRNEISSIKVRGPRLGWRTIVSRSPPSEVVREGVEVHPRNAAKFPDGIFPEARNPQMDTNGYGNP